MKLKHIEHFTSTVLPAAGLTEKALMSLALERAKANTKTDNELVVGSLEMLKVLAKVNETDCQRALLEAYKVIGSRHKVGEYVVYEIFNLFIIQDLETGKAAEVDPLSLAPEDYMVELRLSGIDVMLKIAEFISKELVKSHK